MLLACVQTDVAFADVETNRKTVVDRISQAAGRGAEMVIFPECMLCGYGFESRDEAMASSRTVEDPLFAEFAQLAGSHRLSLTVGCLIRDGDRLFNAELLINGEGVIGQYRKIHLPHLGVDRFVDRGDRPYQVHEVALQSGGTRVGMAICYDSSFPEPMRVLGLEGADIIALGTNWPKEAFRTAAIVPPARSMENHLFFVAANRIGSEREFTYCGFSSICGPDGVVLAQAEGDEDTILYADIDPQEARNKRIERTVGKHVIHRFDDRRPEFYQRVQSK